MLYGSAHLLTSELVLVQIYIFRLDTRSIKGAGVTFSAKVNNIWEVNHHGILNKVDYLLRPWAKRKLTLLGRILIINY